MCLAMNDDVLKPGERCASTSNRNFEGRQGKGGRTHLVSPLMAAAAAIDQAAGQHAMAAVGISALGLAWLHDRCDRFSTDFLRITADFGLYTPLLFFVFSG